MTEPDRNAVWRRHGPNGPGRPGPLVAARAEGSAIYDESGRRFLDFATGGAAPLGHSHPLVLRALMQAGHRNGLEGLEWPETIELLSALAEVVPGGTNRRVLVCDSAREALARATRLCCEATGRARVTYLADVEDDRLDVGRDSAALVVHPLDARIEAAADSCRAGGAMLVDDETGIGPGLLGTMLAIERTRVRADLYVLGSGWAAGLPFGACVTGSSQLHWRGQACSNPLGAAITLAVLRVLKSGLVESAAAVGRHLALALDKANLPWVMAGEGLVWTIAAGRGRAEALVARCREVGLLVRPLSPDSVGLRPALVVSRADVDEAVGILGRIGGKWSKV